MKFEFLTGDCDWVNYGGKFISKQLDAGTFTYWLVLEFMNLEDLGIDDEEYRYNVTLGAVSLDLLPSDKLADLVTEFGQDWFEDHFQTLDEETQLEIMVEEAHTYGHYGPLWSEDGNNYTKLMQEARKRADHIAQYPWSYFEQTVNQVGATALDFMKGNVLGPLARTEEDDRELPAHGFTIQNVLLIFQKNE